MSKFVEYYTHLKTLVHEIQYYVFASDSIRVTCQKTKTKTKKQNKPPQKNKKKTNNKQQKQNKNKQTNIPGKTHYFG